MRHSLAVLFFGFLVSTSAFSQDRGTIQCDPDMKQVPAWSSPGSAFLIENLSCGQSVSLITLERGFWRIQIGDRYAYVNAEYIRLPQTQEQPKRPPEGQAERLQPPTQMTRSPQKMVAEEGILESGLEVGAEVFHIKYEEPKLMRESGAMFGVYGNYVAHPKHFMLKMDGRFSLGNVEYSSSQGRDDIRDYIFESRFSLGYDFKNSAKAYFTPFVGIGYRYLFDGLKEAEVNADLTYDRKSNYLYSPIGLEAAFGLENGWSLIASGEYDLFWHGWQFNENGRYLGEDLVGETGVENNQSDGWGARASLRIVKNLGRINFAVEPYFRYWEIDESDHVYLPAVGWYWWEPSNSSKEWGARVGIRF